MNCFNVLLCQLCYVIVLTLVTGTVMLLFWWLFQALLFNIRPVLVYPLLKFSCLFFLVPVVYMFICVHKAGGTYSEKGLPIPLIREMYIAYVLFSVLMIAIVLFKLGGFLKKYHQYKMGTKENYTETDIMVLEQFEEIRRTLKIKRRVRMFRNSVIQMPKVTGLVFPQVLMPNQAYVWEEYKVSFMHELMHYKSGDTWTLLISNLIMILYGFNPFLSKAMKSAEHWREFTCDVHVCEHAYTGYTPREYYHYILDIVERYAKGHGEEACDFVMGIYGGELKFERRVLTMNKHIIAKKYPKWIGILLVFAFVVTSVPTACAAGMAVMKLERNLTESLITEDCVAEDAEEVEHILYPEEDNCKNIRIMDEPLTDASTYSTVSKTYEWNIPANTRYLTEEFKVTKGGRMTVSGMPESGIITYRIGYVDEDKVIHYVGGTGDKSHTFTMDKTQWVRFFVQNRSATKTLSIYAGYMYVD